MNLYSDQISLREVPVDGVPSWNWITKDHGAFDGPRQDWEDSHKAAYKEHVTDWSVVVQAGGNCGMYPLLLSKMFKTVYTFEPDPLNFYALVMNCQADNIVKMQAALGSHHAMIEVKKHSQTNVGMHTVSESKSGFVPQLCIDDLNLQSCGLIALDVEGYEINALHGALNTIERFSPVIACERASKEVIEFLSLNRYVQVAKSKMDTIYKVK